VSARRSGPPSSRRRRARRPEVDQPWSRERPGRLRRPAEPGQQGQNAEQKARSPAHLVAGPARATYMPTLRSAKLACAGVNPSPEVDVSCWNKLDRENPSPIFR
jgi:hypothetical protein